MTVTIAPAAKSAPRTKNVAESAPKVDWSERSPASLMQSGDCAFVQPDGPSFVASASASRALESETARNDGAAMNEPTARTPRPTALTTLPVGQCEVLVHLMGFGSGGGATTTGGGG